MRLILAQVAVVTFLLCGSAQATGPDGNYKVVGVGGESCGSWTAARRNDTDVSYLDWVGGFVSGVGWFAPSYNPADGLDGPAIWAWIDNYCQAHPLIKIADAAGAFVNTHPR
jgi:hypothetical protein